MLSEALQRNAKHEGQASKHPRQLFGRTIAQTDPTLKAWPGPESIRGLRCWFASLRMTRDEL
jgi:hypothetical protein